VQRHVNGHPVDLDIVGDGVPVLLLHGFSLDRRSLAYSLGPVFARRTGYRRIHVDLPGFGASPPVHSIDGSDAMLDFVLALIDEIVGDERLLIVGESWGAYLARGVVARRYAHVVGVALVCPVVIATNADRDVPEHRIVFEEPGLLERADPVAVEAFREGAVLVDQGSWDYVLTAIDPAVATADPATLERIGARYGFAVDVDRVGDPFLGPSLIVVGRQDATVGYRDAIGIIERFPRATVAVLDESGHNLEGERPRMLAALVDDWLDRVERERP
jgi:pimeloyl-ACP methyl ester carboxylesterase